MFFDHPQCNKIRAREEPTVRKYWEQGLSPQLLNSLQTGQARHPYSTCYHCRGKGHLKANCPDRRKGNKMPWERAWGVQKRKWHQASQGEFIGKGEREHEGMGALQNIIEVTDPRCVKDWMEDWEEFMSSLKVIKVDQI